MKIELSPKGSEILYWALVCLLAHTHAGALEAWAHVEALRTEAETDPTVLMEYALCEQLGFATMAASLRIGGAAAMNNFLVDLGLDLPFEMAESVRILRNPSPGAGDKPSVQ
jgi:hypothetical protein